MSEGRWEEVRAGVGDGANGPWPAGLQENSGSSSKWGRSLQGFGFWFCLKFSFWGVER